MSASLPPAPDLETVIALLAHARRQGQAAPGFEEEPTNWMQPVSSAEAPTEEFGPAEDRESTIDEASSPGRSLLGRASSGGETATLLRDALIRRVRASSEIPEAERAAALAWLDALAGAPGGHEHLETIAGALLVGRSGPVLDALCGLLAGAAQGTAARRQEVVAELLGVALHAATPVAWAEPLLRPQAVREAAAAAAGLLDDQWARVRACLRDAGKDRSGRVPPASDVLAERAGLLLLLARHRARLRTSGLARLLRSLGLAAGSDAAVKEIEATAWKLRGKGRPEILSLVRGG